MSLRSASDLQNERELTWKFIVEADVMPDDDGDDFDMEAQGDDAYY